MMTSISWLIPLVVVLIPLFASLLLVEPARRGQVYYRRGDYQGAITSFQRQLSIMRRFPWLENARYLALNSQQPYTLKELLLLRIAQAHLDLGQPELAVNALWRCLGLNPDNSDALDILEHIRSQSPDRIIGW